ncbi:DUF1671-domain-containing protein [Venustampulla echinocandica]|uniref:DUF1671-domain-containing protein n=1 Tax=Venustampulla echinocandica TaxID=2656787 RepID=A0A370TIB5_9HELO|nr:DUF1671-domain-containing protein [Venustampulla echinocandica]RDL35102.1 DUF1671-domain-containing protein [Venustampulla echinocandica]
MEEEQMSCPFCGYNTDNEYQIMLHMETVHPEGGESPFVVKDDASLAAVLSLADDQDAEYSSCPVEGCGEVLLRTEFDSHLEMHSAEQDSGDESGAVSNNIKLEPEIEASFDAKLSHALRNIGDDEGVGEAKPSPSERQASAKAVWKGLLKMPDASTQKPASPASGSSKGAKKRLGKSELGPHANEKQMPAWLVNLLESDGEISTVNRVNTDGKLKKFKVCINRASGIIPILEQLLEQDGSVDYAYLCHPAVKHISKLKREGGFCGYRNIQMLSSHIIEAKSQGYECFNGKIPTIFEIQDYIENAWDLGINAQGRIETGGIRGTRKYIGTPDAMFCSLGIACEAQGLKPKKSKKPNTETQTAYQLLFQAVEAYFANGCLDFHPKARCTPLPPMYFQHPGHSMTIVGFEKRSDGSRNIIVFDPMFHDAPNITKLVGQQFTHKAPADALKAYRRGVSYLRKYNEFELLRVTSPLSLPPLPVPIEVTDAGHTKK